MGANFRGILEMAVRNNFRISKFRTCAYAQSDIMNSHHVRVDVRPVVPPNTGNVYSTLIAWFCRWLLLLVITL